MTTIDYAEWLKRQGKRIVETESSYWHTTRAGVLQAFPYHRLIVPSPSELNCLFRRHAALALRYSSPIAEPAGLDGYHVTACKPYDLGKLSGWARKNVRRGLRSCAIVQISADRLGEEGWELRLDTLDRQGRQQLENRDGWLQRCRATEGLEGFQQWGAIVDDKLAATLVTVVMERCGYMLHQQCKREFMKEHVNNALAYEVTSRLFADDNVSLMFYGMQSLDAPNSVDEFKFRMGYERVPVKQVVKFHPAISPFVNRYSSRAAELMAIRFSDASIVTKAAGLLKIAAQSK